MRHGIPWATFCTSTIELGRPFAKLPKAAAWIRGHLAALSAEAGLAGDQAADLRFSPYLVIVFSSGFLLGAADFPGHFALVGPALSDRPATASFPWERLDPARRHVLVTVGTMADARAMDFYPRAVEELRPPRDSVQAITRDQPINAANVARVGAGIRVHFYRARPDQLRAAVLALLDDPAYRTAAGMVRDSFAAAGGAPQAAARLEQLAARPEPATDAGMCPLSGL
jgi:zeaxanthin glucosyltransferase